MSTENTIPKQNQLAEAALILTDEDSLNMNIMRETYNKFNSITYSTAELNKFKDNILSLLKERDKFFLDKLSEYKTSTDKIKFDFNSENKLSNSKFSKIIDTQAKMTSRLDQLSDYENFVTKTNDKLVSHDIRLTNIRNDFSLATQKYDKIYLDNLELPGYIGRCAKYKNCQSFFLDVIKDLAKLNIYREKNIIDLKMYKDKLETIISSMNSILDNNNQSQMKYINDMKEKILNDCKSMFETVTDSMKDIRVENSKYTVDLISTSMNLSKKWEKLEKIKEELLEKFNYDVNKYQMLTDDAIKSFEEFKNEYGVIRRKFMELAEFIKDIRFRKNIGGNVKKKEVKQMVKKMLKKRKSFEGENVQLLSDITNIENIDYKKYYNIESNDEGEINNSSNIIYTNNNRSKSLKPKNKKNFNNNNNIKEKEKEKEKEKLNEKINQKNNSNKLVKEIKQKKEMNQSVEDTHIPRINMNNSSLNKNNNTIDKEKDKNKSSRSVNINMKLNISNINNKKNNLNNKINSDEKNIKNNLIIDSKNLKDEENLEEKKDKEMNKINKSKDSNIIKLVKNNTNNNIELRNILDDNNKYIEKKENVTISYSHQDKPQEKNIEKENSNINNSNINKTNIINYEINPIKLNNDTKRSMIEDVSTISDVKNTSSSVNKDNKFSSEKSVSFISDSNGNNINKFIINDIHLEQNDKIIKELASELEQSTAKKDKFEQKFKTAFNNIEPINLLSNNKTSNEKNSQIQNQYQYQTNNINQINKQLSPSNSAEIVCDDNNTMNKNENNVNSNNIIKDNNNIIKDNNNNVIINSNSNCNSNSNNNTNNINMKTPSNENETTNNNIKMNNNIKQNNNDDVNNSNINSNIISSNNMVRNESISNLNPIKINNEIHLNEVISSNSVNSKLHAFDQKLLNLELYTKEKIIEIISQINSLKQNGNGNNFERNSINNIELNRTSFVPNITPSSTEKNKTFNNSFMSTQNNKITHHSSFNLEKAYASDNNQININNENNKNILNINNNINNNSPNQNLLYNNNNFNLDKKKYSLRNVNPKQSLINSKIQKKNSFSYNVNTNNAIKKNIPSNFLTENNNNNNNNNYNNSVINNNILINNNNSNNLFQKNNLNNLNNLNNPIKQNNSKEIIESTGPKIIQSISNDINTKFLKEIEKKIENNNNILKMNNMDDLYNKKLNKNINNFNQNRNNYNDSSFNGAEIKLVDLNKLVNHQLPRNRLVPIHINENEFFDHFKNTK